MGRHATGWDNTKPKHLVPDALYEGLRHLQLMSDGYPAALLLANWRPRYIQALERAHFGEYAGSAAIRAKLGSNRKRVNYCLPYVC